MHRKQGHHPRLPRLMAISGIAASRRVSSVTYGNDRQDTYTNFDGNGNPQTVTLAANGNTFSPSTTPLTVNYTYHPILNVSMSRSIPSVLGPTGSFQETIWDYDTDGNDIPNEHPLNHNPLQRRIEKGYIKDSTGEVISFTHVTTYKYNAKGQVISIDGPLAADDTVRFEYDTKGNLTSIKQPLVGDITFSDYDVAGNPGHMTDQNGQVIALGYDAKSRLTSYAYQTNGIDGPKQTWTYIQGELTTIAELTGRQLDYTYKPTNGLPDRITDQFGNYFKYGYDTRGNTTSEAIYTQTDVRRKYQGYSFNEPPDPQDPNKHRVTGRLWQLINPDTTATIFGYDEIGNINSMTNPLGKTTSYLYDLRGRLTQTTQPGAVTTKYEYDAHSNLTVVTDAKKRKTTNTYDDYGRLLSVTSPDTKTTSYCYEHDKDTTPLTMTITDAKGVTKELRYDVLGRLLTTKKLPDATPVTSFSYDDEVTNGRGRLHSAISPAGTFTYSYNDRGQLTEEDKTIDNVPYTTVYAYDETNTINLKSITYPSHLQVTYARNEAGQISGVQPPAGLLIPAIQASRNAEGLITSIPITPPQTVLKTVTYLPFGGAEDYTFANKFHNRLFDQRYLVTRIKSGTAMDYIYQHDANGNVTNIQGKALAVSDTYTTTLTYAAANNRLTTVTTATTATYINDLKGNITSNGHQTFVYNQNNQLTQVKKGTAVVMDYTYDGLGRRTKKGTGTNATIYHYDQNGFLLGESKDNGTPLIDYIYLENECVAIMIYNDDNSLPILYSVINDHLATPQMVVDGAGAIVWQADYTPYGEAVVRPGNTITFNLRFPGQYFDAETGLHYNWHRYYDPKIGRYMSADPIGLEGGLNLYSYVQNNPVNFIDPRGLKIIWGDVVITNDAVRNALIRLDNDLPNATIKVTAGDRYIDSNGNIRDSTTDKVSRSKAKSGQHLYGNAIDFEITDFSLSENALLQYFDWGYWNKDFPGRNVYHGDLRDTAGCPGTKSPSDH